MRRARARAAAGRRTPIGPPPPGARPFWSVMIPTCDDGDLLAESLSSVLAQDRGPAEMQVAVVDDHSTATDPGRLVRSLSGDRVDVVRHPRRVGAAANFTACIQAAAGRWVHILHADDLAGPEQYAAYRAHIEAHPCGMAVSRSHRIDASGERVGTSPELVASDGLLAHAHHVLVRDHPVDFASVVVARDAYRRVGGFDLGLPHANDWEMWCRLALVETVAVVPGIHASYRHHPGSDTTRLRGSMTYLTDPVVAAEIITARCPDPREGRDLRRHVHGKLARDALWVAELQRAEGRNRLALRSAAAAVRLDPTLATVREASSVARQTVRGRLSASAG